MFCKKCGAQLPDDAAFCIKCGVKVDNSTNNSLSSPPPEKITIAPSQAQARPPHTMKKGDRKSDVPTSTKVFIAALLGFALLGCGIAFRNQSRASELPTTSTTQQKSAKELAAGKQATKEKTDAEKKAHEEAIKPPVTLSRTIITPNVIGEPTLSLIMKNDSQKTINAFKLHIYAYDNYGKQVKQFGHGDDHFSAISQREIEPGGTTSSQYTWTLHGFDNGRKFKVQLYSIHFSDGTEWTAEKDQDVSIEGSFNP